ncbi:MAG: hypothetical protein SVX38_02855, partial [Chloroflexota bacterium]|nr:hypothetical protein [Chloroflexota bacterium]
SSTGSLSEKVADHCALVQELFATPALRASRGVALRDGKLIGEGVELGEDVEIERGAAILGKSKILRGKVEEDAIVVDSVIREVMARSKSVLVNIEQLNDRKVVSENGQVLADVLIMDGGIVKKVRVASALETLAEQTTALVDGRRMTVDEIMKLSDFEASYLGGYSSQFRRDLLDQPLRELFPKSGVFTRLDGNPILEPIASHAWESMLVYNPAAIRLDGITYIVYRALGDDHTSRLGLAWSKDGLHVDGRLPHPIFTPRTEYELAGAEILQTRPREKGGCEDPRLTLVGDRVYMTYSAYGSVLQIALASISKRDFSALPDTPAEGTTDKWTRYGPLFPGTLDRNAVLFPERINGRYVLLRRPIRGEVRDIAISYSHTLEAPWPDEFQVIMQARPGMWDSERVGAGAQVLKTRHGWLLIYHGVGMIRGRRSYMLGTALLDLDDPAKILYRSPEPTFIPEQDYELYGWAPNVVFANGAVAGGKNADQIVEDDDEITIYYGGGDRVVGVAWAKLADLVGS